MRPRIQRAERAYTANGADGAQEGRPFRPSYNREERGFGGEQRSYGGAQRPYRSYQPVRTIIGRGDMPTEKEAITAMAVSGSE